MEVKRFALGKRTSSIFAWCIGNVLWGFITRVATRISAESPMLEGIGYLALIVLGICGAWWYLWGRTWRTGGTERHIDNMTRYVVAMYIAQQHGVPPAQLVGLGSPEAMEERAKRLVSDEELAKVRATESPTQ
jgi:hypothetical protein